MKKLLILLFVVALSGCATYGYYPDSYPPDPPRRYECWEGRDYVTCYDHYGYRYFTYRYGHHLYSYWRGYIRVNYPRTYYVPPRSDRNRGGVATPKGYKESPTRRPTTRSARPRVETQRPQPETRRPSPQRRPQVRRPPPPRSTPPVRRPPPKKVKPRGGGNN